MLASGNKWIKSLVAQKAPEKASAGHKGGGRKWRLWRSSSSAASRASAGEGSSALASEASSASADSFSSVLAAVVRAPPRDFRLIRQEWAAVRIQTAFRAFLARRALKALRGIVRLQALMRGRLVRKQLAVTLKCMHALLRVQERARERRARSSADGNGSHGQDPLNGRASSTKDAMEQWCDRHGSVDEVRSKIHMKHEGAAKRERPRGAKHKGRPSSPASGCVRSHDSNRCNHDLSYLEGWMATKPWETRIMEANQTDSQLAKNCEEPNLPASKLSDASSVKIRRNNVTTRVSAAKPPPSTVLSAASSDSVCDGSSPSRSSVTLTTSATNTVLASEARSESGNNTGGPNYMSLTKSAKARLMSGCSSSHRGSSSFQRQRSGDMSRVPLSSIDTQSNAGSEISVTSKRLNSMSLKGVRSTSMTRSLDKENDV